MSTLDSLRDDSSSGTSERTLLSTDFGLHAGLLVATFLMALPILLAALMSTQTTTQIYRVTDLAPGGAGLSNYGSALTGYHMGRYLLNSLVMSVIIVTGKLVISLLAALALVYYEFPYKRAVFMLILFTLMLPVPVRIVPLFGLMVDLHWAKSQPMLALTAPYLASATTVFLLRQHFNSIPDSVIETVQLDGVGPLTFLVRVLIPMSKGMLAGVAVIEFIYAWNQYLWPLLVVNDQKKQVVQVGVKLLKSASSAGQTQWGLIMAGAIIALVPPLFVLIALHRPLLETFGVQQK